MTESTGLAERTEMIHSPIYGEIVPIAAIQQNITRIQAAKQSVMKEGTHYGVIPGTPKPSLLKPGAELVNLMFGVSVDPDSSAFHTEDGQDDVGLPFFRCSVRMVFKTRSGVFLGASYGYASSLEEKYKWRRATGQKEFAATPDGRKRVKFRRGKNNTEYEELQVRTEVEDIRNTIVQMAMKRGEVGGTKRVHALSDMFSQDLEDLPAEIRESVIDGEVVETERRPVQAGQRKSEQPANGNGGAAAAKPEPATEPATKAEGKNQIGKIKAVEETAGPAWFVSLNTGFKCGTRSAELAEQARKHQAAGDVVDLVTDPAKDPKYAAKLKAIRLAQQAAS
jgi:hypothetical protein